MRRISTSRLMAAISKASARRRAFIPHYLRTPYPDRKPCPCRRAAESGQALSAERPGFRGRPCPDADACRCRRRSGRWAGATASFGASGFALGRALPPLRCMVRRGCRSGLRTFSERDASVVAGWEPVRTCIDSGLQRLMERAVAGFAAQGKALWPEQCGGAAHPLAEHGDPGARGVGRFF